MKYYSIRCNMVSTFQTLIKAETQEEAEAIAANFEFDEEHLEDRIWEAAYIAEDFTEAEALDMGLIPEEEA